MKISNDNNDKLIDCIPFNYYHPYLNRLREVDWAIFGSLTWEWESRRKDCCCARWHRNKDFNGLINVFCARAKLRRNELAFYQATEFGKSGQAHYHFLIATEGLKGIPPVQCANSLRNLWINELKPYDGVNCGIGTADVRAYDAARPSPAVEYCLKRERDEHGNEWERYDYLSDGLKRLIKRKNHLVFKNDFLTVPVADCVPNEAEEALCI